MTSPHRRLTRRQILHALTALGAAGGASPSTPARAGVTDERSPRDDRTEAPWLRLPATPTLPKPLQDGLVSVNGTSVFYARFGEGPSVLMLHGGLANSNYWAHQVEHLARRFSVVVMDTRGHGRSPVTSGTFGYGVFARDVVGLLDALEIREAAVIGWSDGAVTGLRLAMTAPERVSRLFAFGGNSSLDGIRPNGARSRTFVTYANRCRSEYAALSPHPERWSRLVRGLAGMWRTEPTFTERDLAGVKAPTTIADGEYDEIIKRDHTQRMAREIPGAHLAILPAVSHFAMLQDPGQFNAAIDAFLADPATLRKP